MRCIPTRCRAMKRQHWAMLTISRPFPSIEWCGMFVVAIETFMSCGPRRGLIYHYKNRTKLQSVQRTRIVNLIKIKLGSNPEGEIHLERYFGKSQQLNAAVFFFVRLPWHQLDTCESLRVICLIFYYVVSYDVTTCCFWSRSVKCLEQRVIRNHYVRISFF